MYEAHGGSNGATKAPAAEDGIAAEHTVGTLARARRSMLSDDRLAKQAAAGDFEAFETIFSRYQDDLYRFCVGILREPQDAQDAVQNTMVRAMRALPGERREMQLKPWLYRIAHNESVELRRREKLVEELSVAVGDATALTDERAEEKGRLRTLLADIADLPDRQRSSLVLREVNGLGFGEIGAVLGTSPGAVRQALYEARRALSDMDHGRDMHCDAATRMVSDADGVPRDRGVRAHLRDCSPCRRFQAEIKERTRTFAAISPMPAIAAAGALKAALGGSGAATGGSGAAAAGGAGAGAGGVAAGSIGASMLLKPAAGLLAVLAIGTAAVDHGAILGAARHESIVASSGQPAPALVERAQRSEPVENGTVALGGQMSSAGAAGTKPRDAAPLGERTTAPSAPVHPVVSGLSPASEEAAPSASGPQPHAGGDERGDEEIAEAPTTRAPALKPATREETVLVDNGAPIVGPGSGAETERESPPDRPMEEAAPPGQAKKESVPPGQAKKEVEATAEPATASESVAPETNPFEAPTHVPPGQAKKDTVPPGQAKKDTVPPGQAKKETGPPGQAKKQAEPTGEGSRSAATSAEVEPKAPPGQAKQESVPPGQAKKETVPPGQGNKPIDPTSEPTASEDPTRVPVPAEEPSKVPPGQAKKEIEDAQAPGSGGVSAILTETTAAAKVPPGQAKKEEAPTE